MTPTNNTPKVRGAISRVHTLAISADKRLH